MTDTIDPKARIDLSMFDRISITVSITLSAQEWRDFELATAKSGGKVARKICDVIAPELSRISAAREALKK